MTGTSLLPFYSADATTKLARALLTHKSKHYFYTQSNLLQKNRATASKDQADSQCLSSGHLVRLDIPIRPRIEFQEEQTVKRGDLDIELVIYIDSYGFRQHFIKTFYRHRNPFFRRPIEVIVFLSDTIWNNIQLIFTIVGVMYLAISNTGCFSVAANILNRLTIFPIVAVVTVFLTSHRKSTFIIWMIASKFLYGLSSFWMTVFGG